MDIFEELCSGLIWIVNNQYFSYEIWIVKDKDFSLGSEDFSISIG